jgi:hypothetical protein
LLLSIFAGLLSLPLTWMTIVSGVNFNPVLSPPFSAMTLDITGLNGHVTFLFQAPLWFIACIAILANVLQFLHHTKTFAVNRTAEWLTAVIAAAWIGLALIVGLADGATPGIGALMALISVVIPIVCLVVPSKSEETKTEGGWERHT